MLYMKLPYFDLPPAVLYAQIQAWTRRANQIASA